METAARSRRIVLQHPAANRAQKLAQLRSVAKTMDSIFKIPGTNFRVGLDGILGFIPGVGDFAGLVIASYFLIVAAQLQVPKVIIARMGVNIVIDTIVGAIPFLGDIFDFVFTANRKNLELIEKHMMDPRKAEQRSVLFMLGVVAAVLAALVVLFFVIRWLAAVIYAAINGWFPSLN